MGTYHHDTLNPADLTSSTRSLDLIWAAFLIEKADKLLVHISPCGTGTCAE